MRRLPVAAAATVLVSLLALAGCSSKSSTSPTSSPTSSATPSVQTTAVGLTVPADQMPTATGSFGEAPTLTFPANPHYIKPTATPTPTISPKASASATPSPSSSTSSPFINPPSKLQVEVLHHGTGAAVKSGNALVVNYYGAIWGKDTAFDSSYSRNAPASFPIGVGQVIAGWDKGIVQQHVGDRLLISIPPSDGYVPTAANPQGGNSQAGISPTDTLVFVVDVVAQYNAKSVAPSSSTATGHSINVKVTGNPGSVPTISVPSGVAQPSKVLTTVINEGSGPAVQSTDNILLQFAAVNWDNSQAGNTWTGAGLSQDQTTGAITNGTPGPQMFAVGGKSGDSFFAGLIGVKVGSRVVIELPAQQSTSGPAVAIVADIIATFPKTPTAPVQ